MNGIYRASFGTPRGAGTGVVFLQDGVIKGGDSMMYYTGSYAFDGNNLHATLLVRTHSTPVGMISTFGADSATVTLKGMRNNDGSVSATGTAKEAPGINFTANLSPLSD